MKELADRNKRILGVALLVCTAWLLSWPAAGRVSAGSWYYVDQAHPLASDSNPGNQALPWLTIGHAAQHASAGDTVIIRPGFYPERINPANSGAPGAEIAFRADPARSVTMYGFYTLGSDHLRIEGFNITTNPNLTGWTDRYGVFIRSDHVQVVGNYLFDIQATAIQGYWHEPYPHSASISGNHIYHSQMGLGITGYDWVVEGNEVERLYNYGTGDSDYSRFFGDDHLIQGNTFHGTLPAEIGAAHVDCFQTFDNNGEFSHGVIVDGNWCQDFHQGFMGEAHYYHDISHLTFRNNVFAHGWAWGLAVEDISYLTAVNNTFVDIEHHGIGLSGPYAHHAEIYNNIFFDTGTSYWFPDNSDSVGDHNLVYLSQLPPVAGPQDLIGLDPQFANAAQDDYHLLPGSPAIDAAKSMTAFAWDHDGKPRPSGLGWDVGAFEFHPTLALGGISANQAIHLAWTVTVSPPLTATWTVSYQGPSGDQPSPVTGLPIETRSYSLTGLTNHTLYTVTLQALLGTTPTLSDTLVLMPAGQFLYHPLLARRDGP